MVIQIKPVIKLKKTQVTFLFVMLLALTSLFVSLAGESVLHAWSDHDFTCDEVNDGNDCHFRLTNTTDYCAPRRNHECPSCERTYVGYCNFCNDGCCGSTSDPGCGNASTVCGNGCPCTEVNCVDQPASKWRQKTTSGGTFNHCNGDPLNCNPSTGACAVRYINTPPTCSISAIAPMNRGDNPGTFNVTVNDADWGDTVRVLSYQTQNYAGDLNNCLEITTVDGASIIGVVKTGNDTHVTTNTVTFKANPNAKHGIYVPDVSGKNYICAGRLILEIIDEKGDTPDASDTTHCSVDISVTDNPPQLVKVEMFDKDNIAAQRNPNELISQGGTVYVGSLLESKRPTKCTSPVLLESNLGSCLNKTVISGISKKNPFEFHVTITDNNGSNDILQSGIWLGSSNTPSFPLAAAHVRSSVQAMYSESENIQIPSLTGAVYYISRGCYWGPCGPTNIKDSSKTHYLGLSLIQNRDASGGNISNSPFASTRFKNWISSGFPDCMTSSGGGCVSNNIPAAVRNVNALADASQEKNYDWTSSADETHLLCYSSSSNVTVVVPDTNPGTENACPSTCAACSRKVGIDVVDEKTLTFKYLFYFNESNQSADFMKDGAYNVFINALDKVGMPVSGIPVLGASGWVQVMNHGGTCNMSPCLFSPLKVAFDPNPPHVTLEPHISGDTAVSVKTVITDSLLADNSPGSGTIGYAKAFISQQEMLDGEPLSRSWVKHTVDEGGGDYNGVTLDGNIDPHLENSPTASYVTNLLGVDVIPGQTIITGACGIDKAGNMGCGNNDVPPYVFIGPWLKTTGGDIYSNSKPMDVAFSMTIPNTPDNTATGTTPYSYQANSVGTGLVMTAGSIGIAGGLQLSTGDYPIGFAQSQATVTSGWYRTSDIGTSPYNMSSVVFTNGINRYEQVRSIALRNCDSQNSVITDSCLVTALTQSSQNTMVKPLLENAASSKILTISTAMTISDDIQCNGANIIFIGSGKVTITSQITKRANSGCIFVVNSGAELVIDDVSSNLPVPIPNVVQSPTVDQFNAGIITSTNGKLTVLQAKQGTISRRYDRLYINGFIYSDDVVPVFKRKLAPVDNKRFPAEQIIYDAELLDVFRNLLGYIRTVDVICGISTNAMCR